jgi:hypothetical protein
MRKPFKPSDQAGNSNQKAEERILKVWTIDDIEQFKPNPDLYVVGNGHIMKGKDRLHLIVGYAGVGKSRAANYLAYCGATGNRWFDYDIKTPFKTLFIQTENGKARLQHDYEGLFTDLRGKVFFADLPTGTHFNEEWFRDQLKEIIKQNGIGMVILDPWTNVAPDLNHKEYSKAVELVLGCMPDEEENCPAIVVVAHLRKPDSGTKRKQGIELMHEVMGSQTLTSRSRFVLVMERANPTDPQDNRVVVTCAKNNDSPEAPRSCHRRGKATFEEVLDFDWSEYDEGAKSAARSTYTLSDVVDLLKPGEDVSSAEWKQRAATSLGISQSRFYDYQAEATSKERVFMVGRGRYRRPAA